MGLRSYPHIRVTYTYGMHIVRDTLKGSASTLAEAGCRDCDRDYSKFG